LCQCSSVIPCPSVLSSAAAAFSFHHSLFVGQSIWGDLVAPALIHSPFLFDRLFRGAAFSPHRSFLARQSFWLSVFAPLLIRHAHLHSSFCLPFLEPAPTLERFGSFEFSEPQNASEIAGHAPCSTTCFSLAAKKLGCDIPVQYT
jgi:hypothetical protein